MSDLDDDSFLSDLGIEDNSEPQDPNTKFYAFLTSPPMPRIANLVYWLGHEMARFQYTKGKGMLVQREEIKVTPKGPVKGFANVTTTDYARASIEYYLLMMYLPRFRHTEEHRQLCEMDKVLDLLMNDEEVKKKIHKRY